MPSVGTQTDETTGLSGSFSAANIRPPPIPQAPNPQPPNPRPPRLRRDADSHAATRPVARSVRTGPVRAVFTPQTAISTPIRSPSRSRSSSVSSSQVCGTPQIHLSINALHFHAAPDPEAVAKETKRKEEEAAKKLADEALAKKPGMLGVAYRAWARVRHWGGVMLLPLWFLLERIGFGLNLNGLVIAAMAIFSAARSHKGTSS